MFVRLLHLDQVVRFLLFPGRYTCHDGCLPLQVGDLLLHLDAGHDRLALLQAGDLEVLARDALSLPASSTSWRTGRPEEKKVLDLFW